MSLYIKSRENIFRLDFFCCWAREKIKKSKKRWKSKTRSEKNSICRINTWWKKKTFAHDRSLFVVVFFWFDRFVSFVNNRWEAASSERNKNLSKKIKQKKSLCNHNNNNNKNNKFYYLAEWKSERNNERRKKKRVIFVVLIFFSCLKLQATNIIRNLNFSFILLTTKSVVTTNKIFINFHFFLLFLYLFVFFLFYRWRIKKTIK